jgi:histidinol-phosphate aminotransferase
VFIANPNNPTGTWINENDLTRFLDRVRQDVIVVLDEAYFEYVREATYPNGIELSEKYPNLVVTRTFSKAYGMAALRLGYSISHPDVADLMNRIRQPFNVNAMSLAASIAAIDDQDHVRRSVEMNTTGMRYIEGECQRLGLEFIPSVGNFLTIDFGQDAMPIYDALLHKGVIVRPIGVYELPNHLRVTIGTMEENLRFVSALESVLK